MSDCSKRHVIWLILVSVTLLGVAGCIEFDKQEKNYVFAQDFMDKDLPDNIRLMRFGGVEKERGMAYRWGLGPESIMTFATPWGRTVKLDYAMTSPIQNVAIDIYFNDKYLKSEILNNDNIDNPTQGEIIIITEPGINIITFHYSNYNNMHENFLRDSRALAIRFSTINLAEVNSK